MDDLVSRKDLMKKIAHHTVHDSMSCVTFERSTVYEMVKGDMFGLVKDAPAVASMLRWISVEEKLPENEQMVIGYTPCDGYMFVGYYREEQNWKQWYIVTAMRSTKYVTKKVTHWMPLPEAPKEAAP